MKRFLKILGIILLVLVIAVMALAVWQWKYVKALFDGMMYDEEALGKRQVKQTEKTVSDVGNYLEATVRELTEEEKEKIAAGELSQTTLMAQIISEATGVALPELEEPAGPVASQHGESAQGQQKPDSSQGNAVEPDKPNTAEPEQTEPKPAQTEPKPEQAEPSQTQPPAAQPTSDQLVAECVGQLYSLQSQYTGQIASFFSRAQKSFWALREEIGEAAARSSIISTYAGEIAAMENSCDAKVEALLSKLTADLKAIGADTSIVGTLRSAYNSEKAAQRAAYVNRYMK